MMAIAERPTDGLRTSRALVMAAFVVGALFAGISVYWGLGGSWLLETVRGELAVQGRVHSTAAVVLVWAAAVVKAVASALPWVAVTRSPASAWRRPLRGLAWLEAFILIAYGGLLTIVGLLVQAGVITADPDADLLALRWHAYLWDPWFLTWGLLVFTALLTSRVARASSLRRPTQHGSPRWPHGNGLGVIGSVREGPNPEKVHGMPGYGQRLRLLFRE